MAKLKWDKGEGAIDIDDPHESYQPKINMTGKNNYFFLITHGGSITPNQSHWEIKNKDLDFIQMFQSYGKLRYPRVEELNAEIKDVIYSQKLMYELTLHASDTYTPNASQKFSLPPLFWTTSDADVGTTHKDLIGLYHFIYDQADKSCTINQKVLDWNQLKQLGTITYSVIFRQIDLYLKSHPEYITIPKSNSGLGIFSCRCFDSSLHQEYPSIDTGKTHFNTSQIASYLAYNHSNPIKQGYAFSLVSLNIPKRILGNQDTWTGALANVKHQGCALNVLSYYDLLERHYAREMAVCLDMKGTSIFKIVDFINNYFLQLRPPVHHNYLIMRFDKPMALNYLTEHFLTANTAVNNTCTIFKMYANNTHKDGFSELGHTIALMKLGSNVFLTDPQSMTFINLVTDHAKFVEYLAPWNFFDLIFVYLPITADRRFYGESLLPTGQVRDRPENVTFGGKARRRRKTKCRKKRKTKRKTNKRKSKRKTNKRKRKT